MSGAKTYRGRLQIAAILAFMELLWLQILAEGLSWVVAAGMSVIAIYMLAIVFGSWMWRNPTRNVSRQLSYAVLIPAHDEELGISDTVARVLSAEFTPGTVRTIVIADNCSDQTAAMARRAGAEVWERNDPLNRGKGQALDWALRTHRESLGTAALIAFVDADMQVDSRFFLAMSAAFSDPTVMAAQGRYVVANAERSFLSAVGFASFCYVNHVRPAGRCFWGGTADLKGGGMVFRSQFLLPRGWPAHSIAEDAQFGKELMLEGVRVLYVPSAKVESDIPATLAQVKIQQSRWEAGRMGIHGPIMRKVISSLLRRPTMMLVDGFMDLVVPPLSVVIVSSAVGLLLAAWSGSASVWLLLGSLAVFAAAVLSGLLQNRARLAVYVRLMGAPLFLFWKLALLGRVWTRAAPATWQRTPRSTEQDKPIR